MDAGLRLTGGGVDVAHVQADDFGQAEAGAEGYADDEVVARVGGGYGEQGWLLGAGQGLGGQGRHGTTQPWGRARIKGILSTASGSCPPVASTITTPDFPRDMLVDNADCKAVALFWTAEGVFGKAWRHDMMRLLLTSIVLILLTGRLAQAQIVNGSFEDSLSGWTVTSPPPSGTEPIYSPLDHAHGYPGSCLALRRMCPLHLSTNVEVEQTTTLGDSAAADSCDVGFDMFVGLDPCVSTNVDHIVRAYVDGAEIWTISGGYVTHPYQHFKFTAPTGLHRLKFWFHVYNGAYLWIDNITVTPTSQVPVRPTTWSNLKLGYR